MVHASTIGGQLASSLTPVQITLVVDDVVGAELLELLSLLVGGGRGDDGRTGSLCKLPRQYRSVNCSFIFSTMEYRPITYLQTEHAHTASSLHQHDLTRPQRLQTVQRIPARQGRAGQRAVLDRREILRGLDQTLFAENAELAKGAIDRTPQPRLRRGDINIAVLVTLVKNCGDQVALLELGDFGANLDDLAGAVRGGDHRESAREGIFAL